MRGQSAAELLAGVPEALKPLLPDLCEELRRTLSAALEAAGDGPPAPGRSPARGEAPAPAAMPVPDAAPAPGDASETAILAHAFRSSAMFYGLAALASAGGAAEDAARSGRLGEALEALARCGALLGELTSVCAAGQKD